MTFSIKCAILVLLSEFEPLVTPANVRRVRSSKGVSIMERQLLVAILHGLLKKKIYELGRELGGEQLKETGIDMKAAKLLFLDCLEEAFASVSKEIRAKLEKKGKK